jgi:hypothetical protein
MVFIQKYDIFIRILGISLTHIAWKENSAILLRNERPPAASMISKVGEIQGQSTCYLQKRPSIYLT